MCVGFEALKYRKDSKLFLSNQSTETSALWEAEGLYSGTFIPIF